MAKLYSKNREIERKTKKVFVNLMTLVLSVNVFAGDIIGELAVHIELTELTKGDLTDSKVFVRTTSADGAERVQSFDGSESIDIDVPVSKKKVKVFCFESMLTLTPLCEARIIEIEY